MIDCNMYKKDGETNMEPFVAGVTSAVYNEMMGATGGKSEGLHRKVLQHGR